MSVEPELKSRHYDIGAQCLTVYSTLVTCCEKYLCMYLHRFIKFTLHIYKITEKQFYIDIYFSPSLCICIDITINTYMYINLYVS